MEPLFHRERQHGLMQTDDEELQNVSVHYVEENDLRTQGNGGRNSEVGAELTVASSEATLPDDTPISRKKLPASSRVRPKEPTTRTATSKAVKVAKEGTKKTQEDGIGQGKGQGRGSKASPKKRIPRSPLQGVSTKKRHAVSVQISRKKLCTSQMVCSSSNVPRHEDVSHSAMVPSISKVFVPPTCKGLVVSQKQHLFQ